MGGITWLYLICCLDFDFVLHTLMSSAARCHSCPHRFPPLDFKMACYRYEAQTVKNV